MPESIYGIDQLKKVIDFAAESTTSIVHIDQNNDGKVSMTEGFAVATSVGLKFPSLGKAWPEAKKQWKDLDRNEAEELLQYASTKVDLANDELERWVQHTIDWFFYNYDYITYTIGVFKKKAA